MYVFNCPTAPATKKLYLPLMRWMRSVGEKLYLLVILTLGRIWNETIDLFLFIDESNHSKKKRVLYFEDNLSKSGVRYSI